MIRESLAANSRNAFMFVAERTRRSSGTSTGS
jgi:hypothetical protein